MLEAMMEPVAEFYNDGSECGTVKWLPVTSRPLTHGDKLYIHPPLSTRDAIIEECAMQLEEEADLYSPEDCANAIRRLK